MGLEPHYPRHGPPAVLATITRMFTGNHEAACVMPVPRDLNGLVHYH